MGPAADHRLEVTDLGDYKDFTTGWTDTHVSLADAREKAGNHCNGSMKEVSGGYTTTFIEEATGRPIGEYYER